MANPRKFSEKIALHNQKQAEDTAAFEAIMKEVGTATRCGTAALQHLSNMKQGKDVDVDHTSRSERHRHFGFSNQRHGFAADRRLDCSPYGSVSHLTLPDCWRRTHSDSALHTSSYVPVPYSAGDNSAGVSPTSCNTPPTHRRIMEMVGEDGQHGLQVTGHCTDRKKMETTFSPRPRSCEVPNISICLSKEQSSIYGSVDANQSILSSTGSLPDLTVLHFPPPLNNPLDIDDTNMPAQHLYMSHNVSPSSLSPTSPTHVAVSPGWTVQQSPGQRRHFVQQVPSPLAVLGNAGHVHHHPHAPSVDTSRLNYDGVPARQCMSQMLQNRQHSHCNPCHRPHNQYSYYHQPTTTSSAVCGNGPDGACCHGAGEFGNRLDHLAGRVTFPPDTLPCFGLTDVHVGGACKAVDHSQFPVTQYRHSVTDASCHSPTSPLSIHSNSINQSPVLPIENVTSAASNNHHRLQQQASLLQHQFEQINMESALASAPVDAQDLPDNSVPNSFHQPALSFSQALLQRLSDGLCNVEPQFTGVTGQHSVHEARHDGQLLDFFLSATQPSTCLSPFGDCLHVEDLPLDVSSVGSIIPDIVLTGADDLVGRIGVDLSKELGNAIIGMPDNFVTDFFANDEAFKEELGQLDLDGLQMLTDASMLIDPAAEDTFKLDRL